MRGVVRHVLLASLVAVAALLMSAYFFAHNLLNWAKAGNKFSEEECTDPSIDAFAHTNPNKVLFVSCGGFFD